MMAEDSLMVVSADKSELPSTSNGFELLHGKDSNAKPTLSNKDGETSSVLTVRQFCLKGKTIIIFSDLCQVVLKTWGSYNNLYNMLKKHGIKTCRFDHLQLRMLKNYGFVNLQVKNCSYITKKDFNQILDKYDEENNTDLANIIQLSSPVMIDSFTNPNTEFESSQSQKKGYDVLPGTSKAPSQKAILSIHNIHTFSIRDQDFVSLSEVDSLFVTMFRRPDLLNLALLQNLKIDVCKLTANEMARVNINTGVTCNDTFRGLYITKTNFDHILQYTSAVLDSSKADVSSDGLEALNTSAVKGGNNMEVHDSRSAGLPSNSSLILETPVVPKTENVLESDMAKGSNNNYSTASCVIRTCLVEGEVVVCVPDLRKVVIDLYGQSVQLGSFMHRLRIPTHRFSSMILKHLKGHNILSSRATLCTYITKHDAEKLLKMYHMCNRSENQSEDPPRIEWSEPIILENNFNMGRTDSPQLQLCVRPELKIPLFIINHQVVIAMPDVHRAVQLLNGHSVQLCYNLDKLGIIKHKYTYADLLPLKMLGHINRPSTCTYITKADFDILLQFYTTPENEHRLKLIEWQQPLVVERMDSNSDSTFSPQAGIETEDDNNANNDQVDDYSISDLYKVFVGDDLESAHSSSIHADDNQYGQIRQWRSRLSSSSPPSISISPSVQLNVTKSDTCRNEAVSNELEESAMNEGLASSRLSNSGSFSIAELVINPSTVESASPQPCRIPDVAVSDKAADVNRMQVEEHSRNKFSPVIGVSHAGITPTADSPKGVSKHAYTGSHVVHCTPSHSTIPSPDSSLCNPHLGVITQCSIAEGAPSIPTASVIHSKCVTSASRYGLIPSPGSSFTSCVLTDNCHQSAKRPTNDLLSDATGFEQKAKKYRGNDEDIWKTLQRKETEMKILHDAYQGQIKQEREHRLEVQRELDRLKDSNIALLKNIERKELEMQILHDSYKLQMDLERKKREELQNEVFQLRAKLGVTVKQEPP